MQNFLYEGLSVPRVRLLKRHVLHRVSCAKPRFLISAGNLKPVQVVVRKCCHRRGAHQNSGFRNWRPRRRAS